MATRGELGDVDNPFPTENRQHTNILMIVREADRLSNFGRISKTGRQHFISQEVVRDCQELIGILKRLLEECTFTTFIERSLQTKPCPHSRKDALQLVRHDDFIRLFKALKALLKTEMSGLEQRIRLQVIKGILSLIQGNAIDS